MSYRYAIVALSELLMVTRDGERGLRACAQRARSEFLRRHFTALAERYQAAAAELRELVGQLGGDPGTRWVIPGAAGRGWFNLPAQLELDDDRALVDACERGEDHALEVYRNALDDHLPEFVRLVVLRQFESVMNDHHRIRIFPVEPLGGGALVASYGDHTQP